MKHLPILKGRNMITVAFIYHLLNWTDIHLYSVFMFIARQMELLSLSKFCDIIWATYLLGTSVSAFIKWILSSCRKAGAQQASAGVQEYFWSVHVTSTNILLAKASRRTTSEVKDEGNTFFQVWGDGKGVNVLHCYGRVKN